MSVNELMGRQLSHELPVSAREKDVGFEENFKLGKHSVLLWLSLALTLKESSFNISYPILTKQTHPPYTAPGYNLNSSFLGFFIPKQTK